MLRTKKEYLKNSLFPSSISQWNGKGITESLVSFKTNLLKFTRPIANSIYYIHNPKGIHLLTRLQIGLSFLIDHKFRRDFLDPINPLCTCSLKIESIVHFFLHATTILL